MEFLLADEVSCHQECRLIELKLSSPRLQLKTEISRGKHVEELADMVANISVDHLSKLYLIGNISDGDLVHCYADTECEA